MAVLPISYNDTLYNKTGCWREIAPEFLEKIPPCALNCPLKQDIPKIFSLISRDCWKGAYQILTEKNPFPAICGRVCYCACENNCSRKDYDDPLLIKKAEKEIGDMALDIGFVPIFPPLNQEIKVLVVGAGMAGLSAAYFLRKNGIEAKVFEKQTSFGGLARIIPDFRLHSEILDLEIKKIIKAANISVAVASPISKSFLEDAISQNFYQAVILATGSKPKQLNINRYEEKFAVSADEFLKMAKSNPKMRIDRRYNNIVVLGGGNTAMDAALVCRDLFPKAMISIIAPEAYWDMTAFKEMKQAVLNMQIGIFNSAAIVNIKKTIGCWFDLEFQTDYGGYLRNGVSMVISAIGREPEVGLFPEKPSLECYEKLFFTGDIKGTGSVAESIADARRTVEKVLLYLRRGKRDIAVETVTDRDSLFLREGRVAHPNLVYFLKQKRNWKDITKEAERCINCGVCLDCENCLNFCPDAVIRRFFNQNKACYEIDYDYCKGCLICAEECPSGVICAKKEERNGI